MSLCSSQYSCMLYSADEAVTYNLLELTQGNRTLSNRLHEQGWFLCVLWHKDETGLKTIIHFCVMVEWTVNATNITVMCVSTLNVSKRALVFLHNNVELRAEKRKFQLLGEAVYLIAMGTQITWMVSDFWHEDKSVTSSTFEDLRENKNRIQALVASALFLSGADYFK